MAFIRKVYSILAAQLLLTAVVGFFMNTPTIINWTREK
jgi:FtsH-binding integral membrane protein